MSALPAGFRKIRLELAREPKHPAGNPRQSYEFSAPIGPEGRIDPEIWRKYQDHCRVSRFREDEEERSGWLARKPGGQWFFDYERGSDADDEFGFRFTDETFVPGEYVSIRNDGDEMHVYRVIWVEPL